MVLLNTTYATLPIILLVLMFKFKPKGIIMSFATRVRERRLELNLTQEMLAELSELSQASLQKIESGKSATSKKISNIAAALNCTPEYLQYGVTIDENSNISLLPTYKNNLPLLGWVQAGNWTDIDSIDTTDMQYYLCPVNCSKSSFVLEVQGSSMEPRFNPGDQIFVDPEAQVQNLSLVIAQLDEESKATFKQLIIDGNKKYLKAINPDWPEKFIEIKGNCTIIGKVIYKGEKC